MTQSIDEILASTGGPVAYDHRPEGPSSIEPLQGLGLDKSNAEPFPANVEAQQGAGSGFALTPGAVAGASGGSVVTGWKGDAYEKQGGPEQLPVADGIARLTAGGNKGANRPS